MNSRHSSAPSQYFTPKSGWEFYGSGGAGFEWGSGVLQIGGKAGGEGVGLMQHVE